MKIALAGSDAVSWNQQPENRCRLKPETCPCPETSVTVGDLAQSMVDDMLFRIAQNGKSKAINFSQPRYALLPPIVVRTAREENTRRNSFPRR